MWQYLILLRLGTLLIGMYIWFKKKIRLLKHFFVHLDSVYSKEFVVVMEMSQF